MRRFILSITGGFILFVFFVTGWVYTAQASDLYNSKKLYYAVFYRQTKNGDCTYRTEYSQYFKNGKDAYYAKVPAGYKKYVAWCWKDGSGNCDAQILQHGIRSFCKNFGCRQGVYNGRTICDKQR